MRFVGGVLVLLAAGCAEERPDYYCGNSVLDINEECDPGGGGTSCTESCTLKRIEVVAHWSFETLGGDVRSPCLPGDPEVSVSVSNQSYPRTYTQPCAGGAVAFDAPVGYNSITVSSIAQDHEYRTPINQVTISGPGGDLPTFVVYTDAGYVGARWSIEDAMGVARTCSYASLETVRFVADGVPLVESETECSKMSLADAAVLEATTDLRLEGLDAAGNVRATSEPIEVTVRAGTVVDAGGAVLTLMP